MIQPNSKLNVADNTGAKEVMCIKVAFGRKQDSAVIGDVIVCSVKIASPRSSAKKKEIVKAIIVRQKAPFQRKDGSMIKFDDNAVVLINDDNTPRGTRVMGPIAREIKQKGLSKIVSMAPEVV